MAKVKTLILRAPGTNCDGETAFAFEQAGAQISSVHVNRLMRREERLADYQIFVIPGGFSYGDDIASGKVLANELNLKLAQELPAFILAGGLILGICNGFQVLVKAGLLPKPSANGEQSVTLTNNDSGKFECRWTYLKVNEKSPCVFTKGIDRMYLPVAHGEGKLTARAGALTDSNIVMTYCDAAGNDSITYPDNPNGSERNIAGICDRSGRVFALMPHPERYIRGTQHPRWTRLGSRKYGDGFQIFRNAVKWAGQI
jgi:phosphoribosylformylglycinamidine synthase I